MPEYNLKALTVHHVDAMRVMSSVRDYFCCPDEYVKYSIGAELCPTLDYFNLGPDAVCYGRLLRRACHLHPESSWPASSTEAESSGTQLVVPFDPNEVIDNLRLERYPDCQLSGRERALKAAYYTCRPATGLRLRTYLQKLRALNGLKRQFPRWPVDTSVEAICEHLLTRSLQANNLERIPFIWFWPDGAQGCVTVTHDVETASGRDRCADLMDLDESFGFKGSFQIVPEDRYTLSPGFLNRLRDRGNEICIQDLNHDGRLFDDLEEFRRRAALINRYRVRYGARGFRSAVLYRKPEWFEFLDFSFDMSIPNAAHLDPQRGGCCTVMPYFIGRLTELPLTTLQDYTLFHILGERSPDLWRLQVETILSKYGLVTVLVHPDYLTSRKNLAVYEELLAMLSEMRMQRPLWAALPSEIDAWWRARHRMAIVRDRGKWRILGDGAERARLAFARIGNGGKLIYEMADPNHNSGSIRQVEMSAANTWEPNR
jgi:hypothetical protein